MKRFMKTQPDVNLAIQFNTADTGTTPGQVDPTIFWQVLANAGFEVQLRHSTVAVPVTVARQKQLAEWKAVSGMLETTYQERADVLSRDEEEALWRKRREAIAQVKLFKEGLKKDMLGNALLGNMTTQYHVYPSFGETLFFEFNVRNPADSEDRLRVVVEDPMLELQLVTDAAQWRFLRRAVPRAVGDTGMGDVEDDMFTPQGEVTLTAREAVTLPFVFRSLASGRVEPSKGQRHLDGGRAYQMYHSSRPPMVARTVTVTVRSAKRGGAVAVLKVHVHPQPYPVHRTVRFYQGEREVLRRQIVMHPGTPPTAHHMLQLVWLQGAHTKRYACVYVCVAFLFCRRRWHWVCWLER